MSPRTAETRAVPRGRIAGLDALRALAVVLVVAHHVWPSALPGGFIGVDVFFVLSGFLITTILVRERTASGRISLRRFWIHRARRLVPALAVVVTVSVAAVAAAQAVAPAGGDDVGGAPWSDLLVGVGAQMSAAATFTSNWLSVAVGQSYATAGAPALLGNLWSLAVEEQFYVLWPLVVAGALAAGASRVRATAGAAALALASAGAMALLFVADADPTRVYVGTDTHAFGLMAGAGLAFWWSGRDGAASASSRGDRSVGARGALAAGGIGVAVLAVLALWLPWESPATYRGGLVIASFATVAIINAMLHAPAVGRRADVAPLRWIGERSYGIYLWHWPVLVILVTMLDGGRVREASGVTAVLVVAVTVGAAAASYRWVETPVRRAGFRASLRALLEWLYPVAEDPEAVRVTRRRRAAAFGGAVAAVLALAGSAVASAPDQTSLERQLDSGALAAAGGTAPGPQESSPSASSLPDAAPQAPVIAAVPSAVPSMLPTAAPAVEVRAPAVPDGRNIVMIGDSVTLGSAPELVEAMPGMAVEAEVGKQFGAGVDRVERLARAGKLRDYVVVALGTNGAVRDDDVERLVAAAGDRPLVLVTPYGDRPWMRGSQEALRRAAERHPSVVIADWQDAVNRDPGVLGSDGIHPRPSGVGTFVAVVKDALLRASTLSR